MNKKIYKLKIRCANCDTEHNLEIPFGYEWQNYSSGFSMIKAGYGKKCWICRKLTCDDCDFHQIKCSYCGSDTLFKIIKND